MADGETCTLVGRTSCTIAANGLLALFLVVSAVATAGAPIASRRDSTRPPLVGLSCGPQALLALAESRDDGTAAALRSLLMEEAVARPVTSAFELLSWSKRAGLPLVCRHVDARDLESLPLPAIGHFRSGHFALISSVDERWVMIRDDFTALNLPRREFECDFSGFVLCAPR